LKQRKGGLIPATLSMFEWAPEQKLDAKLVGVER